MANPELMIRKPERVLVFGASGHIGGPMAQHIAAQPNGPALRLASSNDDKASQLCERFPGAEVVVADYWNLPSMLAAFEGVDAAFVVLPDFVDDRRAMTNVVAAAYNAGSEPTHVLRLLGSTIGVQRVEDLNLGLRSIPGPSLQFQQAREVLNSSGIPVSYLNSFAAFMDDLVTLYMLPIVTRHTFSSPNDRVTTFVDTRDLGEAGANLLLRGHSRVWDGYIYHVTGSERIAYSEVAPILSSVLGVEIGYEDSLDGFEEARDLIDGRYGVGATDWLKEFNRNEQEEEPLFITTDVLPELLGRAPRTLAEWIEEHRQMFFDHGLAEPAAEAASV